LILSGPGRYVARVSGTGRGAKTDSAARSAATRDRAAERLPPMVRALLEAQDDGVVIFGTQGDVVYLNAAAEASRPPAVAPFAESSRFRAELVARGGRVVPLRCDGKLLGEMIVVPRPRATTWAEQEREAIREALHETGGRRVAAARRLGISRTTLWRRLRTGGG
jgi:Bacterial regulatory protein, Fis family